MRIEWSFRHANPYCRHCLRVGLLQSYLWRDYGCCNYPEEHVRIFHELLGAFVGGKARLFNYLTPARVEFSLTIGPLYLLCHSTFMG